MLQKLTTALTHAISAARAVPIECALIRNYWAWLPFYKRTLFIKRILRCSLLL